ncbi:hypothetical protein V6N13_061281 [Hibiscus sabdariffa]
MRLSYELLLLNCQVEEYQIGRFGTKPRMANFKSDQLMRFVQAFSLNRLSRSVEDMHHLLCSYPASTSVWNQLVCRDRLDDFLNMNLKEWLYDNLSSGKGVVNGFSDGDIQFGSVLWNLWLH